MGRLQNSPSIGWVHPKSTHAHPLAWGNKKYWEANSKTHSSYFLTTQFKETTTKRVFCALPCTTTKA
jgi:hypothetical protein